MRESSDECLLGVAPLTYTVHNTHTHTHLEMWAQSKYLAIAFGIAIESRHVQGHLATAFTVSVRSSHRVPKPLVACKYQSVHHHHLILWCTTCS